MLFQYQVAKTQSGEMLCLSASYILTHTCFQDAPTLSLQRVLVVIFLSETSTNAWCALIVVITCNLHSFFLCQLAHLLMCTSTLWMHITTCTVQWWWCWAIVCTYICGGVWWYIRIYAYAPIYAPGCCDGVPHHTEILELAGNTFPEDMPACI